MQLARFFRIFLLVLLTLGWVVSAAAQPIEAEGSALIDAGGIGKARQAAIEDALRKAEEEAGMSVVSSELRGSDGSVRETSRYRALGRASNPMVVKEWREDNALYVHIRAEVMPRDESLSYRKKIAVTQFHVAQPMQVQDLDNIWNGFPNALMQRLESSGMFLPVYPAGGMGRLELPLDRPQNRETVRILAEQSGAQFVVSGIIHDAGAEVADGILQKALRGKSDSRRIEVEIFIHDGLTGAVITRFRAYEATQGNVQPGRDKPFGSAVFFATDFGAAVARLIGREAQVVVNELGRLPFIAKIVRIEGERLFFDAGATSGVGVGDRFMLYTLSPLSDAAELGNNRLLGIAERPAATLTIKQVQPLFAVGVAEVQPQKIQIGDMIRFERASQGLAKDK
ncbi:MAG: flagellar assembly protein T N-terminal domain-containing protein [Sulfuricella sp.]|nr:flagellar assembly protein T N-terminal domain-containing protein [Sulfuricella sp.]